MCVCVSGSCFFYCECHRFHIKAECCSLVHSFALKTHLETEADISLSLSHQQNKDFLGLYSIYLQIYRHMVINISILLLFGVPNGEGKKTEN